MSYVCTGCGAQTDIVALVCLGCQRWAEHAAQAIRERDEAQHVIDRLDCTRREGGDTRHCRVDRKCLRCERDELREREWVRQQQWLDAERKVQVTLRALVEAIDVGRELAGAIHYDSALADRKKKTKKTGGGTP